jgi:magnesium-transporting ATPase (P-type)
VTSIDPAGQGLTSGEAARRLAADGPNDPTPKKQRSHLVELLLQFADPLIGILLFASAMSVFVGERRFCRLPPRRLPNVKARVAR